MSTFDPARISYSQRKQALLDFLATKPDGEAWRDFFREASAGNIIADLLGGTAVFLAHHTVTGRREAYLHYAQKRSAVNAMAEFLGYSVGRGTKEHHRLTFIPDTTTTISEFAILGSARGQDVVALEEKVVNAGQLTRIEVVFGDLQSEEVSVQSSVQRVFRFTSPDVSEDFELEVNGTVRPVSSNVEDLLDGEFVGLSNVNGAVDIFYLNTTAPLLDTGDTLLLRFVEFGSQFDITPGSITLFDGEVPELTTDDFPTWEASTSYSEGDTVLPSAPEGFYFYATEAGTSGSEEPTWPTTDGETVVDGGVTWEARALLHRLTGRQEPERLELAKTNAIVEHEVRRRIKGREDYNKSLAGLDSRIVSTNGTDLSAAVMAISAVKEDTTLFTQGEKDGFVDSLASFRPFGIKPPVFEDPAKVNTSIQVDITPLAGATVPGAFATDVEGVVNAYALTLEVELDLDLIESDLNQLLNGDDARYIKTARVSVTSQWQADTVFSVGHVVVPDSPAYYFKRIANIRSAWRASVLYQVGDKAVPTTPNGFCYEVTSITGQGLSSGAEPTWPTTPGDTVVDGDVTWTCKGGVIKPWQADYVSSEDEMVSPDEPADHYFKAVANIESDWQASAVYEVGDEAVPTNANGNPNQHVFRVVGVSGSGLSGGSEPTWPETEGDTVEDNDITWENVGTAVPRWQPNTAYAEGDVIVPATPTSPRRAFIVGSGDDGTSGGSEPTWDTAVGNTTSDGTVTWTAIEEGETGDSEPTWPTTAIFTADGARTWAAVPIGRAGSSEPTWPTTAIFTVVDDGVLWENQGAQDEPLVLGWNEYFEFSITAQLTS